MNSEPPSEAFEEQYLTPSERIAYMILKRWDMVKNAYSEMDDLKFARSVKSLARMFYVVAGEEEKQELEKLDEEEIKALEEIRKNISLPSEIMDKKIKEKMFEFAEKRMKKLIRMIGQSKLIVKDVEVDFVIPQNFEEIEKMRKMIMGEATFEGETKFRVIKG